ncbi:hypothetical protein [Roseovarius indicus]|uniref:hypothetical protein n=1 Tax=Roseovarius indicus TaxID=540747 RepID=UPI0032EA9BB2
MLMQWLEGLSYVVTVLGFPIAIYVIVREERLRRINEEHELHRNLTQEYDGFLRLVMDNADLLLMSRGAPKSTLTDEQRERRDIVFEMLVSLFEKAYIILHSEHLTGDAKRRWLSWEDDMIDWLRRPDFRAALPRLLEGEDDAFSRYITGLTEKADRRGAYSP